jgi:hypothetical protein
MAGILGGEKDTFLNRYVLPAAGAVAGGYFGSDLGLSTGAGAAIGAGLGTQAGGGNTSDTVMNAGLGYVGGNLWDAGSMYGGDEYTGPMWESWSPGKAFGAAKGAMPSFGGGGGTGAGVSASNANNMLPMLLGTGLVSSLISEPAKANQEEEYLKNLQQSMTGATWNDTTRAGLMKGLMGQYGEMAAGGQRRAANAGADAGRGGGFYGSQSARSNEAAREAVARALSATYQPYGTDVAQLLAKGNTGALPWFAQTADKVGTIAGQLTPYAYLAQSGLLKGGNG